ncbi:MAG: nascent polypeptide-associated complex protein [Candidatus Diapherotrites archaeon]|uniref:Nascent polypeptide-associated complex protein n=1 Tax=Candidatus Iainarchaeum sp. TaxID=3101447 RepID=A0A8T4C6T6_9ARCH|nr:nascent polypeptide-associated complex protein [Candidatus Diapherotrites archaeon]
MIPGLGNMNPAQMKAMMRQLGIKSEDLDVKMVTIELTDGTKLIFDSPQVNAVDMKGNKTYTITGDAREERATIPAFTDDDVDMVAEQANVSNEDARKALEENDGDLAAAISALKKEE